MELNASVENFERAIELRDSLKLIEKLKNKVVTELKRDVNMDVFGYATNGFYSVISVLVVRAGKVVGASNHFMLDSSLTDSDTLGNFMLQYYPQNSTIPKEIVTSMELDENILQWLKGISETSVTHTVAKRGVKKNLLSMANNNASEHLEKNIEKTKLQWLKTFGGMEKLQQDLHLSNLPVRMECYDISNLQGTNIVASMVVFVNGEPQKSHYRKFKIKTVVGKNNDFESMREVLTRRMLKLNSDDESFKNLPNLIVIDGGKGQLGYAMDVLRELGVETNIVSLAKKQEEVFVPHSSESVYLSRDHSGLKLLQNIRDEAHRFAITFHRSLRNSKKSYSELFEIEGVGEKLANNLLTHFKGIQALKTASYEEILQVKGVSKPVAANIVNYYQNN